MAEKEVRSVKLDEILEFGVDWMIVGKTYRDGKEVTQYDSRRYVCKTFEEARRKANDLSRNPNNSLTASVHIKVPTEKKKLFSKDTKIVDKWLLLEKYVDGRLKKKNEKIMLIDSKTGEPTDGRNEAFDLWS